jgi:hypothetical protein
MLLYTDILTGDEMFSDAFQVYVFTFRLQPLQVLDVNLHLETQNTCRRHRLRG